MALPQECPTAPRLAERKLISLVMDQFLCFFDRGRPVRDEIRSPLLQINFQDQCAPVRGAIPSDIPTELEREYAYDVYGEDPGPGWTADPPVGYAADAARADPSARTKRVHKYPPGP